MEKEELDYIIQGIARLLGERNTLGSSMLFNDWLLEWFKVFKLSKDLKPSYRRALENQINKYLLPVFESKKLADLDGVELQEFINSIEAGNLRKKLAQILNGCLEKAVQLRKIPYNPFSAVELPRAKKHHYRPLEFFEQNAILGANLMERYKAVLWFMCCTGVRIGEFLALDFEKDLDGRYVHISRSMDIETGIVNDTPKTESSIRVSPYTSELEPYIAVLKGQRFTYDGIRNYFKRLYSRLGLKGLNIHSFRHTFVSLCNVVDIPIKSVQTWAGHSSITVTMDIYTHVLRQGTSSLLDYFKGLKVQETG